MRVPLNCNQASAANALCCQPTDLPPPLPPSRSAGILGSTKAEETGPLKGGCIAPLCPSCLAFQCVGGIGKAELRHAQRVQG